MNKNNDVTHVIPMSAAGTLDGLFRERVRRTPDLVAYRAYNDYKQQQGGFAAGAGAWARVALAHSPVFAPALTHHVA